MERIQMGHEVESQVPVGRRHLCVAVASCVWLLLTAYPGRAEEAAPTPNELDCLVMPKTRVEVASPVEGLVESVEVDQGDIVTRGQVLVRLESSVERAAVAVAKARAEAQAPRKRGEVALRFAQKNLDRSAELQRRAAMSVHDLDEAETNKYLAEVTIEEAGEETRRAKLELEQATAALERRTIRSPVDGVVVRRILSAGEYADPPQVVEIAEIDPLYVQAFAPLALLDTIALGAKAQITTEGPARGTLAGTVTVIDRVVDAASGTFGVRLELPNPDYRIPAGLKCRVRLLRE
jgi:RND family efflux transporter MFP subunit